MSGSTLKSNTTINNITGYFLFKYNLDRSTTHPKLQPIEVQTHDLQIMTVHFMPLRCPFCHSAIRDFCQSNYNHNVLNLANLIHIYTYRYENKFYPHPYSKQNVDELLQFYETSYHISLGNARQKCSLFCEIVQYRVRKMLTSFCYRKGSLQ